MSRPDERRRRPHPARWVAAIWLILAAVLWLGMFDVLISRGVKEYLYRTAEHELGRGPSVTMPEIMSQTIHDAVIDSSIWALLVAAAGVTTGRLLKPQTTDEKPRST